MAATRNVIVGAGTAGWNAITAIREADKGASEITLAAGDEITNTQGSADLLNLLMRFGTGT